MIVLQRLHQNIWDNQIILFQREYRNWKKNQSVRVNMNLQEWIQTLQPYFSTLPSLEKYNDESQKLLD